MSPRCLAVDPEPQLLHGALEHLIHLLLESEIVLSVPDALDRNDATGTTA